ncbi:aminotransferase class I/II-fold pyridoxal phosphate-dependent enzyme [Polyangium fumosum]|uniref:Aminotransferase class I/classII large domain-containing protein n=1 Tax=Polyangium fumosum TaxID=889272 RepID=A0A4U1IT51_9BACT|nr:aminotransferase class I/II-fold pyridoxal phosphate-dependent enzyme [Polyangium fumosum]TKC97201.1 hypothetical protein E8A74_44095 [Polyangium fumosum]
MNHETFLARRAELRAARPSLVDLAELNVYRSLGRAFPSIVPSTHPEAPYRCHLAERFLAHLDLPQALKPRTQVSHGVRRSLRALFGLLARRNARVGVPADVYPVYLHLAAEAGATIVPWEARAGLPALDALDALLICEPLKPWGTALAPHEADALRRWARADDRRMLILDSVYATPPTEVSRALLEDESAVFLTSLSKGWLVPDHAGICIVPERFRKQTRDVFAELPKDEGRLRIGYAALTEHAARPQEVSAALRERARRLDALTSARPELKASPCTGYFATSSRSFHELLEMGILGVPATVFGGPEDLSVLSSLEG